MRTYGYTPDDVTALPSGAVAPGVQLTVWDAPTAGAQVLDLLDADEAPLPGYVLSGADGAYGWKHDGTFDYLYASADAGATRWAVQAHEALADKLDTATANSTYVALGRPAKPGALSSLTAALADGSTSCALQVLGDSTGYTAGKTRWPQIVAPWIGSAFPAYGVQSVLWDDTATQAYAAPVTVKAPPNGYPSASFSNGSAVHPGYAAPPTGDIDIRVKVSSPDWTVNTVKVLAAYWGGLTNTRAFSFTAKPTSVTLAWSSDGITQAFSQQSTASPTYPAPGVPFWLRATLQPNNAGQWTLNFYQSPDGVTWTRIGATWTNNTGPTSIFAATGWQYEIGANQGTAAPFNGTVYAVEVRDGIDGPSLVPYFPDAWSTYTGATVTRAGSPILTVVNGSAPGRDVTYLSDSTRLPKMTPFKWGTAALVLSCSHNDGTSQGAAYLAKWDAWLTAIRNRHPYAGVVVTAQNPRIAPAANIESHANRRLGLINWAAKNGLTLIDVFRAFKESATPLSSLVEADGIHPSDASGSPLWAATVESAITGRS